MKTAIVGGGAAGFFLAINLKEMMPTMEVTILERSTKLLAKVEVSGGGRCNCTNSFAAIRDLQAVYPRGHRLMKRLMKGFSQRDAYDWFEAHGVRLMTQADECVFPLSQDSHTIINCFLAYARRLGIEIRTSEKVTNFEQLADYDFVAVTCGGQPKAEGLQWLADLGHETAQPVPSLFTFQIADEGLRTLMGTVAENAVAITAQRAPQKQIDTIAPEGLTMRHWTYLAGKALGERATGRWSSLNQKELNRLANALCCDTYEITGRAPFKDEFVTCGGIALEAVNPATLESRHVPRLFFAGEILDIDGITGGFNFQAAWTTAYTVAKAIANY